eukprot:evm.model.scf_59.10 EVM.evm.TU.scf_59.10   scf_59:60347-66969(+)
MKQRSIASFFGSPVVGARGGPSSSGGDGGRVKALEPGAAPKRPGDEPKPTSKPQAAQARSPPKGKRPSQDYGVDAPRKPKRLRKAKGQGKAAQPEGVAAEEDVIDSQMESPRNEEGRGQAASVADVAGACLADSGKEDGSQGADHSDTESDADSRTSASSESEVSAENLGGRKAGKNGIAEPGGGTPGKGKATRSPAAKKRGKKKAAQSKAGKVEGVGAASEAAAALYSEFKEEDYEDWDAAKGAPYKVLTDTFQKIGNTTKRLEITLLLTNTFRRIIKRSAGDLLPAVYLCVNRVAPAHEGLELGLGDATLIKAIAQATGKKEALIKSQYEESGDLGTVAVSARHTQRVLFPLPPLTISGMFQAFKAIAMAQGSKSQDQKKQMIGKLFVSSKGNEAGYIVRSLQGKLRIGLAEQTVLTSLAHAVLLERDSTSGKGSLAERLEKAAQTVKQVYSLCPTYNVVVPALLEHGLDDLSKHAPFSPGMPVRPMLAKPTSGVSEVLDKFSDCAFTCEYKYDGERAQIHVWHDDAGKQKVQIYSRNAENNTSKYPDLVARMASCLKEGVKSAVLDCEAVAYDIQQKRILPFQVLSTRARKDVTVTDIKVQVCLFCFDCLYFNGRLLFQEPLTGRRQVLNSVIKEKEGEIQFAKAMVSREVEELEGFLNDAVAAGTEGLIVKTLDATYEPSQRSLNWLKLKKDYLEGCGDTFDVVPIGAWHGKGKRKGGYGSFLLAIYNPGLEELQTICKIGTGFSEEQLKELSDQMRGYVIGKPKKYYSYGETLIPDVWFDAKAVWEIKAADLSISPVHQAARGMADPSKGISIRFPRLVRVRDDKAPEDATTAEQVTEMYQQQTLVQAKKKSRRDMD